MALLAGVVGASVAGAQGAGACQGSGGSGSQYCVMLVQIDGLEAQDLTREKMPFTWALSHPGTLTPEGLPAAGLGERDAWIWQAARGVMTSNLGSNTASLLTGGYPQQHGIPSDEFNQVKQVAADKNATDKRPTFPADAPDHYRLEADPDNLGHDAKTLDSNAFAEGTQTLLDLVEDDGGKPTAFVGDPNLAPLVVNGVDDESRRWAPGIQSPDRNDQQYYDPAGHAYCNMRHDIALDPAGFPLVRGEGSSGHFRACPVRDEVVLRKAFDVLSNANQGGDSRFTYIELAEVGHVKRYAADRSAVNSVLAQTDLALAEFFYRYASPQSAITSQKWPQTVLFLTGSGGYEPAENFVRDPEGTVTDVAGSAATGDLADYVQRESGGDKPKLVLYPQGSVATVYYTAHAKGESASKPTGAHLKAVREMRTKILDLNNPETGGSACDPTTTQAQVGDVGPQQCIEEVLYMRPELAPQGPSVRSSDLCDGKPCTVQAQHPDWHLENEFFDIDRDTFEEIHIPTGTSGDLLVVMAPGWRAGRPLRGPLEMAVTAIGEGKDDITAPYPSVTGSPRNRSIAAFVNGPQGNVVRNLRSYNPNLDHYPVGTESQGGPDNPKPVCPPNITPKYVDQPGNPAVAQANSSETTDLADDANAPGHECQAEIGDIGLTIAGLMKLPVRFQQIGGRLLYEGFHDGVLPPTIGERPRLLQPKPYLTAGPLVAAADQDYPHNFDGLPVFGFVVQPDKGDIELDCILVPGEVAPANLPQDESQWIQNCATDPSVRRDLCQNTVDKNNDGDPDLDRDGKQILAPFPCFSYAMPSKLANGVYTFAVKAHNESEDPPLGPGVESTATFRVAEVKPHPGYQCERLLCGRLKAYVSDESGRPAWAAKKSSKLNSITLKGGFGERFTAVALTFYERNQVAIKRARRAGKRVRALERVKAIAQFQPFVLRLERDAKAKLTLEVPSRYRPTHIGVQLQKLRKRNLNERGLLRCQRNADEDPLCRYSRVGSCDETVKANRVCVQDLKKIKGAQYLHRTVKPKLVGGGKKGKGKKSKRGKAGRRSVANGAAVVGPTNSPGGRTKRRDAELVPAE